MNLITDRTIQDVDRAEILMAKAWEDMTEEEQAEWSAGLKGSYNASDLNRVGAALNQLRNRLVEVGRLSANSFTAREDWSREEIPTVGELAEYLHYVSVVRGALAQLPTTPAVPTVYEPLGYQEANNIEQIIVDVDDLITRMMDAAYYSGDLFSGEV